MLEILAPYFALSIILNVVMFLVAYRLQSDKFTDISYALTFAIITAVAVWLGNQSMYAYVLLGMIILWAIRLGGFLLYRVIKKGKDARFDEMRSNFLKFAGFWLLQGLSVAILTVPIVLALSGESTQFGSLAWAGLVVFLVGLAIEAVADYQKDKFTSDGANRGKWIDTGIWRYSRHPNYFGEILVWVGVYIYAIQSLGLTASIVAAISPIFIMVLLIFVSGIPLLEKAADKKWGDNSDYQRYKARTSVLVPLPLKK